MGEPVWILGSSSLSAEGGGCSIGCIDIGLLEIIHSFFYNSKPFVVISAYVPFP